jgi:hypothetical protein
MIIFHSTFLDPKRLQHIHRLRARAKKDSKYYFVVAAINGDMEAQSFYQYKDGQGIPRFIGTFANCHHFHKRKTASAALTILQEKTNRVLAVVSCVNGKLSRYYYNRHHHRSSTRRSP